MIHCRHACHRVHGTVCDWWSWYYTIWTFFENGVITLKVQDIIVIQSCVTLCVLHSYLYYLSEPNMSATSSTKLPCFALKNLNVSILLAAIVKVCVSENLSCRCRQLSVWTVRSELEWPSLQDEEGLVRKDRRGRIIGGSSEDSQVRGVVCHRRASCEPPRRQTDRRRVMCAVYSANLAAVDFVCLSLSKSRWPLLTFCSCRLAKAASDGTVVNTKS